MPDKSNLPAAAVTAPRKNRYPLAWVGNGFLIILAVLAAYILVSNLFRNPIVFLQNILDGLKLGFVYALIALGYTMVYGIVKLINFAHGDIFMVGAFTSFFAVSQFNLHKWPQMLMPGFPAGLSIIIGSLTVILLSMLVCTLLGVTIERVAYKPLRDAPRIAALITAIGVSFFLEFFGALQFVFSPRFIPYKSPFDTTAWYIQSGIHPIVSGQASPDNTISFSNIFLIILVASVLVQIFLQFLVRRTKIGIAMRATSFDKPTARLMGINVDRVISFTFAIGSGFRRSWRCALCHRVCVDLDPARHPSRPESIRCRGPRRNWKPPRRLRRRSYHGPGRITDYELHLDPDARCRRLHNPDRRAAGKAHRHLRRAAGEKA